GGRGADVAQAEAPGTGGVPGRRARPIGCWSRVVPEKAATFPNNPARTSLTLGGPADINTIQFTAAAPAYSFTISSAFSTAGIVNSSAFAPTFIINNSGVVSFDIDDGTTFSGTISGSGSLVKEGEGTLMLSGDSRCTGGTLVNEGTLAVRSSTALGTGTLSLTEETTTHEAASL